MDALELINSDLYQLLVRRAAHNRQWAEYFLLLNACCEVIKRIPQTPEEYDQANIEKILIHELECLGKTIGDILPGGAREFQEYMPLEK